MIRNTKKKIQIKCSINTSESSGFQNIVAVIFPTDTLTKSREFEEKLNKKT